MRSGSLLLILTVLGGQIDYVFTDKFAVDDCNKILEVGDALRPNSR